MNLRIRFTIGREESSDVYFSDGTVSRKHCTISFEGDAHYIEDDGSLNGTIVNDLFCDPGRQPPPSFSWLATE